MQARIRHFYRALSSSTRLYNASSHESHLVALSIPSGSPNSHGSGNHVARLRLCSKSDRNAFSTAMLAQLKECIRLLQEDSSADKPRSRVVIVESNVERIFCAGANLKERLKMEPAQVEDFVSELRYTLHDLSNISIPTIAKISGAALGGGAELALACDIRIADSSTEAATIIGLPETKLAIIPGAGGTQRLARIVGLSRAKELVFSGRALGAHEALKIGFVDFIAEGAEATEKCAFDLASEISQRGPVAIKWAKQAINKSLSMPIEDGLEHEKYCYSQLLNTKDRLEGLQAFVEKRSPKYSGK